MRRTFVLLLVVTSWLGCQARLFTHTVDETTTTTVSKGTIFEEFFDTMGFSDFLDMDITTSEELQNQGVVPGDIQEVTFTVFELQALSPQGADLSFIDSMDLYIEAEGLPAVLFASAADFPEGVPLVRFDLEDLDLTEYVVSQAMTITTEVNGHRPSEDTEVEAHFEVEVGVTGQGACNQLSGDDTD